MSLFKQVDFGKLSSGWLGEEAGSVTPFPPFLKGPWSQAAEVPPLVWILTHVICSLHPWAIIAKEW